MGRMARRATFLQFAGERPLPAEEKRLMIPKAALAAAVLLMKWVLGLKLGESQYPTHRTIELGWKAWPSRTIWRYEVGDLYR
jgi:hypothetical protein